MARPRKNMPKKKHCNRSSTAPSFGSSSSTSAVDLPPVSWSAIVQLISGCAEQLSDFSGTLKLGFRQVLRIVQSVDMQSHWLLDGELRDVIFLLRSCTEWLGKRYESIADTLDKLLGIEPGEGTVTAADLEVRDDSYAAIESKLISTPYLSSSNQSRKDRRRRRQRTESTAATVFPRQIQDDKLKTMLEELNVTVLVLTILAEEMENLGSQIMLVRFREKLNHQALPLTMFTIYLYKNAEKLLLRRGIRDEGGNFSSELSDDDEVLNEVWIASTMDRFRAAWATFKHLYLLS